MKQFTSEADLRSWVREGATEAAFFVEPSYGSTFGAADYNDIPDKDGKLMALELKWGEMKRGGKLTYSVRPAQRRLLPRLEAAGVAVGFLVGVPDRAYLVRLSEHSLAGFVRIPSRDVADIMAYGRFLPGMAYEELIGYPK